jgi:hypothetical protein
VSNWALLLNIFPAVSQTDGYSPHLLSDIRDISTMERRWHSEAPTENKKTLNQEQWSSHRVIKPLQRRRYSSRSSYRTFEPNHKHSVSSSLVLLPVPDEKRTQVLRQWLPAQDEGTRPFRNYSGADWQKSESERRACSTKDHI